MKDAYSRIYIIIGLIVLSSLIGCADILDTERPPLVYKGHGVKRQDSPSIWSRDFGPEQSGHFRSLAVGDFNNDLKADIVGGSYEPGTIFLWYGDNSGNWTRAQRFKIQGDIRSLAVGDLNNDGWLDVVSSSMGDSNGIQVWINENGKFRKERPVIEKDFYNGIRVADINNDGNMDVIAANKTKLDKGGINVWLGNGKGHFIKETGPTRRYLYSDVEVADFNNDGWVDIVGAAWGHDGGALRVWLGTGDGRWSAVKTEVDKGSYWGVNVADVNGDGNPDIISAANFDGVKIHYGDGRGNFPEKKILAKRGSFWKAKAVDLNNDGLLDVAATLTDNNGIIVWYQDPKDQSKWIVARDEERLPKDGFYFDIDFADFNADSRLDVAATTYGEGIKVWMRDIDELAWKDEKEEFEELGKTPVPVFNTSIFFNKGTEVLGTESKTVLNNLLEVLKSVEGTVLSLKTHTDDSVQSTHTQTISKARIKAVTDFFTSRGISQERIELNTITAPEKDDKHEGKKMYGDDERIDIAVNYGYSKDNKPGDKTTVDEDPFTEKGDLIPVQEYQVWKMVDGVPEYRIGVKDQLKIKFWIGLEEKEYDVIVSPQNTVSFSYIKDFEATGYTPTELEREFTARLSEVIKDPFIKVEIPDENKAAYSASIFGAVRTLTRQPTGPGPYRLYGKERFTEFLARVGGHLETADLTRVQLTRNRINYFINVYDALFRSDYRQDIVVDNGDVFFIPSKSEIKNRVFVLGEVARPGLFSFDQNISLLDAVISAGGPTVYGKPRHVLVIRGEPERPEVSEVNLMDVVQRGDFRKNLPLNNGDVVYVARNVLGDIRNFIRAFGPFLQLASLPSGIYDSTSIPKIKGFPFQRDPAPTVSTIIQGVPTLPPGAGAWGSSVAD